MQSFVQNKICLSYKNERIVVQNSITDDQSCTSKIHKFLFILSNFLLFYYSKITFTINSKEIIISSIDDLIQSLGFKEKDIQTKDLQIFSHFSKEVKDLKENYTVLAKLHCTNLNIGNVNIIYDLYDSLLKNIDEIKSINDDDRNLDVCRTFEIMISQINLLCKKIGQINNITKALKVTENRLLIFLQKSTKLLDKNEQNEQYTKSSYKFDSISVDDKNEPILTFSKEQSNSSNSNEQQKKIFEEVYMPVIQEFKKQIEGIFVKPPEGDESKNQNQNDINFFFQTEITQFTNELSKVIEDNFTNQKSYSELLKKLTDFLNANQISEDEQLFEYDFDRSSSEYLFLYLHFISKYHYKQDVELIMRALNKISDFYEENVGDSIFSQVFSTFIYTLENNNSKSLLTIYNEFVFQKIKELNKTGKNKNEIKNLFKSLMKNLIDGNVYASKIRELLEEFSNGDDDDDDVHDIRDSLQFNDNCSSYKIVFNNDCKVMLHKAYKRPVVRDEVKREKRILSRKLSRFIVNADEYAKEDENVIQYYPFGTLKNFIKIIESKEERKRVELTNVDKIVILLEIAIALNDLHSHEEYHGNLCDQSIFINSQRDAYIGSVYNDNDDKNGSVFKGPILYRSPDYFKQDSDDINEDQKLEEELTKPSRSFYFPAPEKKTTNKQQQQSDQQNQAEEEEEEEEEDDDDDDYDENQMKNEESHKSNQQKQVDEEKRKLKINKHQMNDIFSYGVIMHEVLTDTNPESRMGNKSRDERLQILKGNYYKFLLKGENNECFDKNSFDSFGNNLSDFKGIIKKCLKMKQEERYQSMKEIINSIKETSIYERNKTEIEYRLSNAIDSRKYECKFSDIVDSYYKGQENCFSDIEKVLSSYTNFMLFEEPDPNNNIDKIMNFFHYSKYQDQQDINVIFTDVKSIIRNWPFIDYKEMLKLYKDFLNAIDSNLSEKNKIVQIFNEAQNENYYFYFDIFNHCLINTILEQKKLSRKFHEFFSRIGRDENLTFEVLSATRFNEINSTYKLLFDGNGHFYLQKDYDDRVDENMVKRDKNILSNPFSKWNVCNMKDINDKKIVIPYYSFGTLYNAIRMNESKERSRVELTNVEKIVILLEIATALDDLHSHEEYHGNLCDQFVFINSQHDAYIGSFCHDIKLEGDATKPRGPFYFRAPEKFTTNKQQHSDQQNQAEVEVTIRNYQMGDIFSFGVIMHEVLTDTNPESRMNKKTREEKLETIQGDIFTFLLSGENNECFDENSFDSFGNNLSDFKGIIENCLKMNQEERYPNMKEIIDSIKETSIYKRNQDEIEYRLSNAIDSRSYECTISDIVESYYKGQEMNNNDIEKSLVKLQQISTGNDYDHNQIYNNGDIIKFILDSFNIKYQANSKYFDNIFDIFLKLYISYISNNKTNQNVYKYNTDYYNFAIQARPLDFINENAKDCLFQIFVKDGIINKSSPICDAIYPLSTLDEFIQNNRDKISLFSTHFLCNIVREVQEVHSRNLYFGNLSTKTIGIFRNINSGDLIASHIMYCPFCDYVEKCQSRRKCRKFKNLSTVDKQRKDKKKFFKISEQLGFPEAIMKKIKEAEAIIDVCFVLQNEIGNSYGKGPVEILSRPFSKDDYKSYRISFHVLRCLFNEMINNYSFESLQANVWPILNIINEFLKNLSSTLKELIENIQNIDNNANIRLTLSSVIKFFDNAIPNVKVPENLNKNEINKMFAEINSSCSEIMTKVRQKSIE